MIIIRYSQTVLKIRTVMMWMEDEEEQELVQKIAGCSGGLNEDPEKSGNWCLL